MERRHAKSTGVARVCQVLSAICEEYERDPLTHPDARGLCAAFSGMIALGQSTKELEEGEQLLRQTFNKHWEQIGAQRRYQYTPRSLDVALVYVCLQALEQLKAAREEAAVQCGWGQQKTGANKKQAPTAGVGCDSLPWARDQWCQRLMY